MTTSKRLEAIQRNANDKAKAGFLGSSPRRLASLQRANATGGGGQPTTARFPRKANSGRAGESGLKSFEKLKKRLSSAREVGWHWEMGRGKERTSLGYSPCPDRGERPRTPPWLQLGKKSCLAAGWQCAQTASVIRERARTGLERFL